MPYYAVFFALLLNLARSTIPDNLMNQVILNLRRNDFIVSVFLLARKNVKTLFRRLFTQYCNEKNTQVPNGTLKTKPAEQTFHLK